ncbi:hypothetical protein K432DRAFT_441575 [Lepidopterella palustris CBS 459.81]|uniref:Uncharacterized protein n=1 Tax=Lepidopterella palustris CBS 459.81 TaxID=1314670 RepID=A0A8E2EES9_9PEZI|nr:hypothetical protein K432DRAFT_441575 [Lepidopterella palustris CBS 459.81]
MGNNQSAAQHNRLSKPMTNTNSPFSSPRVDNPSPSLTPTKYSDLNPSEIVVQSPTGGYRSWQDARQQLKAQLTSPLEAGFSLESSEDGDLGELATHVRDRLSSLSRSNSVPSQYPSAHSSTTKLSSLSGSKLSLVSETRPVDLEAAISILQELRKNASPEDLAALHKALLPPKVSESTQAPIRGPVQKQDVVSKSSQFLIRQRSLATPGLATRDSPTDALRKQGEPHEKTLGDRQEHQWKLEMMVTSPLTRLAALDLAEDGSGSPTPRAQTPGDMAYSHLGVLQLGSLVVTNGAASPAPSVMSKNINRRKSTPDILQEEDYFTASEGCNSPVTLMHERAARSHIRSQSSVFPMSSPLSRESRKPERDKRSIPTPRSGSPLKRETYAEDFYRCSSEYQPAMPYRHVETKSAPLIAQDYMNEIASSPFADQEENLDGFGGGENRSSFYKTLDEGFTEPLSADSLSFRDEAFRILDGTIFAGSTTYQDFSNQPAKPPDVLKINDAKIERPAHTKADSGYSSGTSLRALQRESQAIEEGIIPSLPKISPVLAGFQESGDGADFEDTGSLYTFEQMLSIPPPKTPDHESTTPKTPRLSLIQTKSWKKSSSSNTPALTSPITPISVSSSHSTESKKSAMYKKLQKRRPMSQQLPVVQSSAVKEGSIPSIPDNVRAHFRRRLSESPGMGHLTRTFASTSDTNSSDDYVELRTESIPIRFPSPTPQSEPRPRKHMRSQSARPPTPPHRHRRSISIFRREKAYEDHSAENEIDDTVGIADFGTVAKSLGSSPYDIAMSTLKPKPVTSPTHPYQISTALPRAKSMASMDSATASEFARMRSRERAASGRGQQRPRSYHECDLEAGKATASRKSCSNSMYNDMPPVPSIESHRLSLAQALSPRAKMDLDGSQASIETTARSKLVTRETSVSALIEKFDQQPARLAQAPQPDWEAHSRAWRQRRKSIGEGLRCQNTDGTNTHSNTASQRSIVVPRNATHPLPTPRHPPPTKPVSSSTPTDIASAHYGVFDRYSGGLDYGYEHGFGVGGSAGTRLGRNMASRKSIHFRNQFGIDLSDVPVFLQRAN